MSDIIALIAAMAVVLWMLVDLFLNTWEVDWKMRCDAFHVEPSSTTHFGGVVDGEVRQYVSIKPTVKFDCNRPLGNHRRHTTKNLEVWERTSKGRFRLVASYKR